MSTPAPERTTLPPRRAWLVLFGCLMCQLGAGFFYGTRALAPDVIEDLGWTRTMWSSGMAPMLLVSSVVQAFMGAACVRFGIRAVLVVALVALAGAMTALSTMTTLAGFYLAVVLLAIGSAGVGDVTIGSVVTRWFDRLRGPALGIAFVGSNLGAVIFVEAIASLSTTGSWRQAALYVGVAGTLLILPFALFIVREPRVGEQTDSPGPQESDPSSAGVAHAESVPLGVAVRRPGFWLLFYVIFCYAFAQLGMYDHLMLYLSDLGYERREAADVLGLTVAAGILAKLGAGFIALRMRARTALLLNTVLLATSLSLLAFAERAGVLEVFGVLFGISTAARDVLFPLLVAEVYGVRYFAALMGVMMMAFFPGGVIGPLVLATAFDVLGSYEAGFVLSFALVTLAIGAIVLAPRFR